MADLSRWDRFWIGVLGAHPDIAKQYPVDVPALRTFGYQLAALWLLFFVIQGIALSVIAQSIPLGLFGAAISSTILILAERIFVNGDWFNEGHYWTLHEVDPNDPRLWGIRLRRGFYVFTRMAIGIAISISVVSIAEPGLFLLEQKRYADTDARAEKPGEFERYDQCKQGVTNRIERLQEDLRACSSGTSVAVSGPRQDRLAEVRKRIDQLEELKRSHMEKYAAECGGREYVSSTAKIAPTGKVGCRQVAESWRLQAVAVEEQIKRARADESELEVAIQAEEQQASKAVDARIAQCPNVQVDLRAAIDRRNRELDDCDRRFKNSGAAPEDKQGGLMRTIQYYLRLKADSDRLLRAKGADPRGVETYLTWFKAFVVFLEIALFLSKVIGGVRGYAKAVYRAQSGSGQGVPT